MYVPYVDKIRVSYVNAVKISNCVTYSETWPAYLVATPWYLD